MRRHAGELVSDALNSTLPQIYDTFIEDGVEKRVLNAADTEAAKDKPDGPLNLARVNAPLERLKSVELPPFQAGIEAGTDAVMIAHVAFPALEPDPTRIATTSRKVRCSSAAIAFSR